MLAITCLLLDDANQTAPSPSELRTSCRSLAATRSLPRTLLPRVAAPRDFVRRHPILLSLRPATARMMAWAWCAGGGGGASPARGPPPEPLVRVQRGLPFAEREVSAPGWGGAPGLGGACSLSAWARAHPRCPRRGGSRGVVACAGCGRAIHGRARSALLVVDRMDG
jgi:hypothetical protein